MAGREAVVTPLLSAPSSDFGLLLHNQKSTLPENTCYCEYCGMEFQPAPDTNAPRRDRGGCCTKECATEWKRAYNKRRYQQKWATPPASDK